MDITTILDIIIALILVIAVVNGYVVGLVMKAAGLLVLLASYMGASLLAKLYGINPAYYIAIFAGAFIIIDLVLRQFIKVLKIVDHIPVVGMLDRIGGAVVGFIFEFVLIYIICSIVFTFFPQSILNGWGLTHQAIRNSMLLSVFVS